MMKRLILLLMFVLLVGNTLAQDSEASTDEEAEDIPFVQLSANFSVPQIDWVTETGDESVWFIDRELDAQIYVTKVATENLSEAIVNTIPILTDESFDAPFAETRIGRTTGTWTVQLFKSGDTSVTAYAMLQSGQSYVVIFAENSSEYEAYHYPIRPENLEPSMDELEATILDASNSAVSAVFSEEVSDAALSYPNAASSVWIQADYDDSLSSASFLYDSIVFVTLVKGNTSAVTQLSNAFDTVFLGFVITPENSEFLYLGLTFSAVIMLALIGSMWLRYQNIQKDMALVEQLAEE